jgi:hypothetical protein
MVSPKIALFAGRESPQLQEIKDAVVTENGHPLIFDIKLGGEDAPSVSIGHDRLMWNGIDFSDIKAIHIRGTAPNTLPSLPPVMNAGMYAEIRSTYLREQEVQSVTMSFFEEFKARGGLLINPLDGAYIDHDSKSQFYEKLRATGYVVPQCLSTNSPELTKEFVRAMGKVVMKPASGVGSTRPVTPSDLEDLGHLRHCPTLFQEHIEGETIRVHIVGDEVVLALKIFSGDGVDSRTGTKKFEYIKLPDEEERRIVTANRFLGLHYSAWDIVASKDGRFVYLDCNPGPFVMWVGPVFRKHIFEQLAAYMTTFALTGSIAKASKRVVPWEPQLN